MKKIDSQTKEWKSMQSYITKHHSDDSESLNQEKPKVKVGQIRKTADEINYRLRLAKIKPQDIEAVLTNFSPQTHPSLVTLPKCERPERTHQYRRAG